MAGLVKKKQKSTPQKINCAQDCCQNQLQNNNKPIEALKKYFC
jgi:hypothetical protein